MSDLAGGPHLRPVPAGPDAAVAPEEEEPGTGLTPPLTGVSSSRFVSDVVVELGMLPRERVDAAVEEARAAGRTPEQVLVQSGALTDQQLSRAIAQRFGLTHADLNVFTPDLAATNMIPPQAARRLDAVPIGYADDGSLMVAIADPSNVLALDDLKLMTGHEVQPVVASRVDIAALIAKMNRLDDAVAAVIDDDYDEEVVAEVVESAADAPVIKLVNSIVAQAIEDGAS